ncbi:glycoside hydrolase family 43 protein [Tundrisphaera sp. TA3]|uniref:glycoside hydrolase family 43 protein n=1 Tax=Tundrisphaera sp. TA3 TaxID=3435775 RepID=UPI003EB6B4D6
MAALIKRALWMLALLPMSVGASAQEAPGTFTNPVYAGDFPDPFSLKHGGRYYAYATQTRGTGFQLLESDDLVRWTRRPLDFPIPWATSHLWAPEVVERDGRFYMTYSALDPATRRHHIAIATADRPDGPFTHRAILVRGDDNEVGVIDATIAFDGDKATLIYSEERPRRIVARAMTPDLMGVEGPAIELLRPDLDWESGVVEAPTVVRRNGLFHLFYSGGPYQGTKAGSRYAIGHASAPALLGPYRKTPEPLLGSAEGRVYGPGHQSLIEAPDGSTWVLYHAWDAQGEPNYAGNRSGRTLRLDPVIWEGDTPRIPGPSTTPRPAPR